MKECEGELPEDLGAGADVAEPIELPIDGVLDLHAFAPRDVADLVDAYIEACRERGILSIRIIHGKGTGHLRRRVCGLLKAHRGVRCFRSADATSGGWGATLAELLPLGGDSSRGA